VRESEFIIGRAEKERQRKRKRKEERERENNLRVFGGSRF
jgi:hypothetical protein